MLTLENSKQFLQLALSQGGDFAELFEEETTSCNYAMLNGSLESANSGTTWGISIRIYDGLNSVYGYVNTPDQTKLEQAILQLAQSIGKTQQVVCEEMKEVRYEDRHPILQPLMEVKMQTKLALMQHCSDLILKYDPLIKKALINYADEDQHVIIANSQGRYITERRQRTRMRMQAVAMDNGITQTGMKAPGAHRGFEFYEEIKIDQLALEAAKIAKTMLYAKDCPSGEMTVVIDHGFGGVIFHEACGHSLEATSVAKGNSVFCNKLGQKVASELVTAVDDGTIANAWGSNNIDDEGEMSQRNVLIEKGILKSYLIDRLNGRRMNRASTSSSRRQNYTFEPTSRMTNTFIENGTSTFEEIISDTPFGLYAKTLGGGSVNPASGDFNFAVLEAYMIREGKIAEPVKGATLVGNGSEVLFRIDKIANNRSCDQGMCGSRSGSIPTDVGQPTLRVSKMTVGGKGGKAE